MNEKQKWKHILKKIRIGEQFLMKAESSDIRSDDVKKSGGGDGDGDEYMKFLLNVLCIKQMGI